MHCVDLGVMKKLMKFWFTVGFMWNVLPDIKAYASKAFSALAAYTPREFNRKSRCLSDLAHFTAKEFRTILLYTGPPVLKNILPKTQFNHFLFLHAAYRILNDENSIQEEEILQYAHELLRKFVQHFPNVYHRMFISFNVHALLHLVFFVRRFKKTLYHLSAYPFESFLRQFKLGKLIKSSNAPIIQVARRLYEFAVLMIPLNRKKCEERKQRVGLRSKITNCRPDEKKFKVFQTENFCFDVSTEANRFCEVDGKEIFKIQHFISGIDGELYASDTVLTNLISLYTIPCPSQLLGIYAGSAPKTFDPNTLEVIPVTRITGKFFRIPILPHIVPKQRQDYEPSDAFVRLLHNDILVSDALVHF